MCGIIAIFGESENLRRDIRISLRKIKHRGSDRYESITFDSCALGVNRLAIIDRDKGKQPFANEDSTVFAIQNGEIFNYKELKESLIRKGHHFKTDCDTEVLVHLWEEYGTEMISRIDSEMYAFVIYDKRDGNIFIARDPLGVKPLCYAYDKKGRLFVASEIKQLSQFKEIDEIREFPSGNFTKYYSYSKEFNSNSEEKIKKDLKKLIEEAVQKRVQTDLPIGVFLSGGVDSSLIMELATKYHKDVTAIILGTKSSSDYINAVKLCKERKWKYNVIEPNIDYEKESKEIVYYTESFEPNIIRHSFANNLVSKAALELELRIVLVGEGSDELFGGYNEFLELPNNKINFGCIKLLESMSKGHMMRVDKMAMRRTIEVRSPFFDTSLVNYALSIPGELKVKESITKYILREVAKDYLPEYIAYRHKAPFANGAGMNVGTNFNKGDGIVGEIANKKISDKVFAKIKSQFKQYNFKTKEEIYYFLFYLKFNYNKFKDGEQRLIMKDNLSSIIKDNGQIVNNILSFLLNHKRTDRAETFKFNHFSLLKESISDVLEKKEELKIVGYWGVEKEEVTDIDKDALNQLSKIQEGIREYYENTKLILILTDIHGELNKISSKTISSYYKIIQTTCYKLGIKTISLSQLWVKYGYKLEDLNKNSMAQDKIKSFMVLAAQRHHHGNDAKKGLLSYMKCSEYDKLIIYNEFSKSLFFTYNGYKWKSLLPPLPTLSLWVSKKGNHIKPWHNYES